MLLHKRGLLGLLGCLSSIILLSALAPSYAEDKGKSAADIDQQIIGDIKEHSDIKPNLTYLSDVIGPRMTGSANLKRANEWTAQKFREYGLEEVRMEPWEIPAAWERGSVNMKLVDPDNGRHITAASMAWTPGTNGKVTGEVVYVQANNQEELNKYKGKLKNAIIMRGPPSQVRAISDIGQSMFGGPANGQRRNRGEAAPEKATPAKSDNSGQPPSKTPNQLPPQERNFGQMFQFRNQIQEFCRKEGAACILTDSAKPHGLLNMTGSWRGRDRGDAADPIPTLFVTHDDYAMLYRLVTRKDAAPVKADLEIQAKIIPGPVTVYNTVGEIRGSEKPNEFVVVGAHLDSWDLGQGTTDNGTGSSVVLETARVLGKLAKEGIRPKRTIRFCLFTGEEEGLVGSREYVNRHKDEMARTSMALVHDTGTGKVTGIGLLGRETVKEIFEKELTAVKELGVEFTLGGLRGGTDHWSFETFGQGNRGMGGQQRSGENAKTEKVDETIAVPGFAFNQDPAEYYLTHHSQSDTLDKARWPDLNQGAQVMAVTAMRVANLPDLLPRIKKLPKADDEKKPEEKKPG
jgi:hypothetical protein